MQKRPLVLIHGALGSREEFKEIAAVLSNDFAIHCYEIPGHGMRHDELHNFSLHKIVQDFTSFLDSIGSTYIFGFSLGGYIALQAAQLNQKNIRGIVTLGTKLEWNKEVAENETKTLNTAFLKNKIPKFYNYLLQLHGEYLPTLLDATKSFMIDLGQSPPIDTSSVRQLEIPVRVVRGGKDQMVTQKESFAIAQNIKNGHYFEVPHFIHPIGFLRPKHVAQAIKVQVDSLQYRFLNLEDKKIAYRTIEKDSKYRFIFLHEALGSIAQWKDFPDRICQETGVSATLLEMEGYGFSSPQHEKRGADYLHRFAFEDIPLFIEQLDYREKLIFIGHSDGGTNALLFAAQHPQKVAGVITMAAHILNEPETRAGIPPAIKAFEEGKLKGLELYHGAKTNKLFYDWAHTWLSPEFKDWNITSNIQGIPAPGLIIQGVNDQYGTDDQVHRIAASFKKKAQSFFIDDCGHSPHLEKQTEVIHAISNWLIKEQFHADD
jgi:pimeloyl-ACP methyl ester carboxylesterase